MNHLFFRRRSAAGAVCALALGAVVPCFAAVTTAAGVMRVVANLPGGDVAYGSGVVIGHERLATNCHVVRDARSLAVDVDGRQLSASVYAGDGEMDLCLLSVPGLKRRAVPMRSTREMEINDPVYAIGYPAGGSLVKSAGKVESTYRMYDARVLRVSARFEKGASGGGLFNAAGELIGLLTFKTPRGEAFHFAIPVDWIGAIETGMRLTTPPQTHSFWERDPAARMHFLRAAWYSSVEDWPQLAEICEQWMRAEPDNDEALTYLRLAESRMRERE
jgi:serine protease Do